MAGSGTLRAVDETGPLVRSSRTFGQIRRPAAGLVAALAAAGLISAGLGATVPAPRLALAAFVCDGGDLAGEFRAAFQANTGRLWTATAGGGADGGLGMAAGSSPDIAATAGGPVLAFQANTGALWTAGPQGCVDWGVGMRPGTSPAIAALPGGGFQVAFQANSGALWTVGAAGWQNWNLGMAPGTSPAIAALPGGGFQVAIQANSGALWTVGAAGWQNWNLGMAPGTSPAIAALPGGGFQVAIQANSGALWTVGAAGWQNWNLGMAAGTSPAIAGLPGGGFQVAIQANSGLLWTIGGAGWFDTGLGMMRGTGPDIAALPAGGYQAAFQANTGRLWFSGPAGAWDRGLGMARGTSPAIATGSGGFSASVSAIDGALAARMQPSWRTGCPVPLSGLRYVRATFRGFDGADHLGELVVAASHAAGIVQVFRSLYAAGYPLTSMRLVDDFGGSDDASMDANNTSAFNCRTVAGTSTLSEHAYGTAIDVNPVQNPYVSGGVVSPAAGAPYAGRPAAPGVLRAGDEVVAAFGRIGWRWGGTWTGLKDYMHFSASGR